MPTSFDLSALLTSPIVQGGVFLPFVLILCDFLTGTLSAFRQGTFDFAKWADLYTPDRMKDLGRCFISALAVLLVTALGLLFWGNSGAGIAASISSALGIVTISAKIVKSIASNISEVIHVPASQLEQTIDQFVGLPAPNPLVDTSNQPAIVATAT